MSRKPKTSAKSSKQSKPTAEGDPKTATPPSPKTAADSPPPDKAIPQPKTKPNEGSDFLRALRLVSDAVIRCSPALLISLLIGYVLLQTDQGSEVVINGLLAPNHKGAWIFGFAILYFSTWSVQYIDEFLRGWRASELDRYTAFARYEAPALVALLNPLIFLLLVAKVPKLSAEELDDFKLNAAACMFGLLFSPVLGRFFAIVDYKNTTWRERKALRVMTLLAFIIVADVYQEQLYIVSAMIFAWAMYLIVLIIVDWFIVARYQPITIYGASEYSFPSQAMITMIIVVILGIVFMQHPLKYSRLVGAPIVLLLSVAFWTSVWCLIALLITRRGTSIKLVTIASVTLAFWLLFTDSYNEARIRTITASNDPSESLDVNTYINRWLKAKRDTIVQAPGTYPVIIVAAEGGGIRAAYWTAGILTRIHDHQGWGDHLLAVSGVSGGAVGAGVFAALTAAAHKGKLNCETENGAMYPCVRQILGADLLSPPLAYMLMNDGISSILRSSSSVDRTVALEKALEEAFASATGSSILDEGFAEPWRNGQLENAPPLVVSNMTIEGQGQRAVLAPVNGGGAFADATDVSDFVNPARIRISTAAILSARFPFISATALIESDSKQIRLVDGGYVDNSGTATALNLVEALLEAAQREGLREKITPIVVPLKNGEAQAASTRNQFERGLIGTLIDPLATMDGVRAGSASRYELELSRYMASIGGEIVNGFELKYGNDRFPLGWSLGVHSVQLLDAQIVDLFAGEPGKAISVLFGR